MLNNSSTKATGLFHLSRQEPIEPEQMAEVMINEGVGWAGVYVGDATASLTEAIDKNTTKISEKLEALVQSSIPSTIDRSLSRMNALISMGLLSKNSPRTSFQEESNIPKLIFYPRATVDGETRDFWFGFRLGYTAPIFEEEFKQPEWCVVGGPGLKSYLIYAQDIDSFI